MPIQVLFVTLTDELKNNYLNDMVVRRTCPKLPTLFLSDNNENAHEVHDKEIKSYFEFLTRNYRKNSCNSRYFRSLSSHLRMS